MVYVMIEDFSAFMYNDPNSEEEIIITDKVPKKECKRLCDDNRSFCHKGCHNYSDTDDILSCRKTCKGKYDDCVKDC